MEMKKTLIILAALGVLVTLLACEKETYKLGDTGPAGGIVFYDRGSSEEGWRYLEAAPAETEFTAQWGLLDTDIDGTETGIGSGKRNTQLIIATLGENGTAALLCDKMDIDGYNDWFLPSKDELDLMYNNLSQKGRGGFSQKMYWSSSQGSNNLYAWRQSFIDGTQIMKYNLKNFTFSVRAVRAF